jgi:hypothetical protein
MAAVVAALACASPAGAQVWHSDGVTATVTSAEVALENGLAERRWARSALRTTRLADLRDGGRVWSRGRRDFTLRVAGAEVGSDAFRATDVDVEELTGGGLRVTMRLEAVQPAAAPLRALRIAEARPGVAGFRTQTVLEPQAPLVLSGATLDEAAVGSAAPTLHAFRAGADWREPDWGGPPVAVGDPHAGTWRDTRSAATGRPLEGAGQWLSAASADRTLFMVMERSDLPSSRAGYDGAVARLEIDYGRDVLVLGPFEEQAHLESPLPARSPGRARVVMPGERLALEPAFTGFGAGDGDEPWQFDRMLDARGAQYRRDVVFNSNGVDANEISTGAKDDMDLARVQEVAAVARRLGVETFVLDDGWQARSGDWQPDSPQHPEPRGTPPRFPDAEFRAVREAIAPMRLGLWMSPLHFHPSANVYRAHPDWACHPAGDALAVYNTLDPESGSNEAGIAQWSAAALPHVEARIREGIERWDVDYWKFDFLVWLDCAGAGDLYDLHDAFVAMLDRLRRDHPDVTFQIDETNDYRLFPFESASRGPSWFQNGAPDVDRLLHNLWNLSPYLPPHSLGQHVLGGRAYERHPVDTLMAAALPSHITLFSDIRELPAAVVERAAEWIAFYKAHRAAFAQMAYPLLDDPLARGWTALQPWNPETGEGALLAFRQGSSDATRRIALRNVPPGRTFELIRGPGGEPAGTATSEQLATGIDVTINAADGAQALVIRPLEEAP